VNTPGTVRPGQAVRATAVRPWRPQGSSCREARRVGRDSRYCDPGMPAAASAGAAPRPAHRCPLLCPERATRPDERGA
jgi:hypothetical protein